MKKFFKKFHRIYKVPLVSYILSAAAIIGVGFILFNVAFILAWLVNTIVQIPLDVFLPDGTRSNYSLVSTIQYVVYLIIVAIISWLILKSKKFSVLVKAIYLTMPTMIIFVTMGMLFNKTPIIMIGLSAVIALGAFYYLYLKKLPWQYWLAIAYVLFVTFCIVIIRVEI